MFENNSDINFSASIDQCLAEEIKKRGWYKNSKYDRKNASVHKKLFGKGKLPYEVKKVYLESLGYEIIQVELWKKK